MSVVILRGDARALPVPDESVDLVVTSPPYFGLRVYQDGDGDYAGQIGAEATPAEYIDALIECTAEMVRVLKPTGSIWVNLGDAYDSSSKGGPSSSPLLHEGPEKLLSGARGIRRPIYTRPKSLLLLPERYRIACVDRLQLIARAVTIWSKPNGMPESVRDRVRRSHEDWVHLTREPRYYADLDPIREPASGYQRPAATRTTPPGTRPRAMADTCNPAGRVPGSVWEIPTQPLRVPDHLGVDHHAAFPMEWPRRLITGWCPPGGTVLDPFGGTGTTALVADVLGRTGITVDRSADYCRIAQWRCSDPRERARAAGMDASQVQAPDERQGSLLDLIGEVAS